MPVRMSRTPTPAATTGTTRTSRCVAGNGRRDSGAAAVASGASSGSSRSPSSWPRSSTNALVTYTLLILVYACNNLPYSALSGVLTGNMAQRNSMSAYRFVAVMVAQFIVQVLLLPLVLILGDGDKVEGFRTP